MLYLNTKEGKISIIRLSRHAKDSRSPFGSVIHKIRTTRGEFEKEVDSALRNLHLVPRTGLFGTPVARATQPGEVIVLRGGALIASDDVPEFPSWIGIRIEHRDVFAFVTRLGEYFYALEGHGMERPSTVIKRGSTSVNYPDHRKSAWDTIFRLDEQKLKYERCRLVKFGTEQLNERETVGWRLDRLPDVLALHSGEASRLKST